MQTHAPAPSATPSQTVAHVVTEHRPRVHQMRPGWLFLQPGEPHRILALLHYQHVDVADGTTIWCVVVAAGSGCTCTIGDLVPLSRNAVVQRLRVVGAMQLAQM